jgi:hypothetical protein
MITPTDQATAQKAALILSQQNSPLPIYIPPEPKQLTGGVPELSIRPIEEDEFDWGNDDESEEDPNRPGYYRDGTVIDPVVMEPAESAEKGVE